MGHIALKIKNGTATHPYVIFDAHFLSEAWISAAMPDGSTHIVKQFDCKKVASCFDEVIDYISNLGTVVDIQGYEVGDDHQLLNKILADRSILYAPRCQKIANLRQAIRKGGKLCRKYIAKMHPAALAHHVRNGLFPNHNSQQ